jgi:hypothetical protein
VLPPYQDIREFLKNHENTSKLTAELRDKFPDVPAYFVIMDSDVENFNGVFSGYEEHAVSASTAATVMSSGYQFSAANHALVCASKIDMDIRIETAKAFPEGVYYPEPNMCILIPEGKTKLYESFVKPKAKAKNLESAVILRQVKDREGDVRFVFLENNPIITSTPARAETVSFSGGFASGGDPTEKDKKQLAQVSQSHLDPKIWAESLYMLRKFDLKGVGAKGKFVSVMYNILLEFEAGASKCSIKDDVLKAIGVDDSMITCLVNAAYNVAKYKIGKDLHLRHIDTKFNNIIKKLELSIEDKKSFLQDEKKVLVQIYVLNLFFLKWSLDDGVKILDLKNLYLKDEKKFNVISKTIRCIHNCNNKVCDNFSFNDFCEIYDFLIPRSYLEHEDLGSYIKFSSTKMFSYFGYSDPSVFFGLVNIEKLKKLINIFDEHKVQQSDFFEISPSQLIELYESGNETKLNIIFSNQLNNFLDAIFCNIEFTEDYSLLYDVLSSLIDNFLKKSSDEKEFYKFLDFLTKELNDLHTDAQTDQYQDYSETESLVDNDESCGNEDFDNESISDTESLWEKKAWEDYWLDREDSESNSEYHEQSQIIEIDTDIPERYVDQLKSHPLFEIFVDRVFFSDKTIQDYLDGYFKNDLFKMRFSYTATKALSEQPDSTVLDMILPQNDESSTHAKIEIIGED